MLLRVGLKWLVGDRDGGHEGRLMAERRQIVTPGSRQARRDIIGIWRHTAHGEMQLVFEINFAFKPPFLWGHLAVVNSLGTTHHDQLTTGQFNAG